MRWLRHLFAPSAASRFPAAVLERIATAIADGEKTHSGQVCFAVESGLGPRALWNGADARARAEDAFARLRVWDTAADNGVLVYLLLADRGIEIVADRGVPRVESTWAALCERMAAMLRAGEFEAAALTGVAEVTAVLARHCPRTEGIAAANELPDRPTLIG